MVLRRLRIYLRSLLPLAILAAAHPALAEPENSKNLLARVLQANPTGLTAEGAAEIAVQNAPSVALQSAEIAATRARSGNTLARYVPSFSASAGYTRTSQVDFNFAARGFSVGALNEGPLVVGACPGGGPGQCVVDSAGQPVGAFAGEAFTIPNNNFRLDLGLSVPFSDYAFALLPAKRAAERDEAAAVLLRDGEAEQVRVTAKLAFYDWIRAKAQLAVSKRSLVSAIARVDDAVLAEKAGTLPAADVLRVKSLVASSRVAVAQSESFESLARQNLALLMGSDSLDFTIGEDVLAAPPDLGATEAKQLIASGIRNRPEAKALDEAVASAQEAGKGAAAGMLPRLDGVANYTYANPNPQFFPPSPEWNGNWSVGLQLSWRLDGYFQARAKVRELDASETIFLRRRGILENAIRIEILSAWGEWARAFAAVKYSQAEIDAAEATYEQRVLLFRGGEATSTDIIEAELQRHSATLRAVNAKIDLRVARAKLVRAAALKVPESRSAR